jgi:glutamate racemase
LACHRIGRFETQLDPEPMLSARSPIGPVGIFDSGAGGLSVLRAMLHERPDVPLHYVADAGHAPYGERQAAYTIERSLAITSYLIGQGAKVIVVACNTATAVAIDALRERCPQTTFVGVEPGIKPAAQCSPTQNIGVMATSATLDSSRFRSLIERHALGCRVTAVACPGLAAAIERGPAAESEINALLDRFCAPLENAHIDTLVLGCTHYPFVADRISQRLGPAVHILDTSLAIARQAFQGLMRAEDGRASDSTAAAQVERTSSASRHAAPSGMQNAKGMLKLETTGDTRALETIAQDWLNIEGRAFRLSL